MECPQCKRDVDTLHGNGTYPNPSYKCGKCHDDDTGTAVSWIIAIVLWVTFFAICASQI